MDSRYPKKRNRRQEQLDMQDQPQQPQPQLVEDDDVLDKDTEIAQLRAQIALLEQALQAPAPQPAAESGAEPEAVETEAPLPPMVAMGLQMIQTAEGRKALAGMVSEHLKKVDLQVRNDGVSVAIHSNTAVFRADAWMESTKAVASSGVDAAPKAAKTIPLWGEGSLDYSDFF